MQFDDVLEPQERTLTLPARVWLELEMLKFGHGGSVETVIWWLLERNRRGREWEDF